MNKAMCVLAVIEIASIYFLVMIIAFMAIDAICEK